MTRLRTQIVPQTIYNAFSFQSPSTSTLSPNGSIWFNFDPTGANNYSAVTIGASTSYLYTPYPHFASYAALYQQFKLLKVKLIFTAYGTAPQSATPVDSNPLVIGQMSSDVLQIIGRHMYDPDYSTTPITAIRLMDLTKVKKHIFTVEHPTVSFTLYPRVLTSQSLVTGGGAASDFFRISKPGWQNSDDDAAFYGFAAYIPAITPGSNIQVDIQYTMAWRQSM